VVCLTVSIGTFDVVNTRECGVEFGVWIDDVVELLLFFTDFVVQDTETVHREFGVDMSAITTVVIELVGIFGIDGDVIHIFALYTEIHCCIK